MKRFVVGLTLVGALVWAGCSAETEPATEVATTDGNVAATVRAKVSWESGERGYWRWELSESPTFASGVQQTARRDFGPMGASGGPAVIAERVRSASCSGVSDACSVLSSLRSSTRYYVRICGELSAPSATGYRCFDSNADEDPPYEHDSFVTAADVRYQTDSGIDYRRCGAFTFGTPGADTVFLSASNDTYDGLAGQDQINGLAGNDCLVGGPGQDTVSGDDGDDVLVGGEGADGLRGLSGNDDIDAVEPPGATGGIDSVTAGAGDDDIKADDGVADTIDCGPDQDRVDADAADTVLANCELRVDLTGRVVYHAKEWTGDPSTGGQLLAEEWADPVTRSARHEESDWLATRGLVPCDDAQPSGPQCAEVRERTTFSDTDPSQADTYYVQRGLTPNDPTVKDVADLLDAVPSDSSANARGPLSEALQSWQVAPPGPGTDYVRFDRTDYMSAGDPLDGPNGEEPGPTPTEVRIQVWVEHATRMPLRSRIETVSGQVLTESFWTYEPGFIEASSLPAGFFLAPRPVNVELDEEVLSQEMGSEAAPASRAAISSLDFDPHHLGDEVVTGEGRFCLARLAVIRLWEKRGADSIDPGPGGDLGGLSVMVNAAYNRIGDDKTCRPGKGPLESPELEVDSTATDSATADTWRYAARTDGIAVPRHGRSPAFEGRLGMPSPTADGATAHVVPLTRRTSAVLVESGRTTVTVTGPNEEKATTARIAGIATRLEVTR